MMKASAKPKKGSTVKNVPAENVVAKDETSFSKAVRHIKKIEAGVRNSRLNQNNETVLASGTQLVQKRIQSSAHQRSPQNL